MNKIKFCSVVLGCSLFAVPVQAIGNYASQREVDNLREDIEVLQRQLYRDQSNVPAGKSSDILVRMSDFEEQIRNMNGKVEELGYKIKMLNAAWGRFPKVRNLLRRKQIMPRNP